MRHSVSILTPPAQRGGRTTTEGDWPASETLHAEVKPLSGKELERARQLDSEVTHRVTMRQHSAIPLDANYRIAFDGRVFEIGSVIDPDERGIDWEITCTEHKR